MTVTDPGSASEAVAHLRRLGSANDGRVPTWAVRAVADRLECTERTIWLWLQRGTPAALERRTLSDDCLVEIAAAHGNRKVAWRNLHDSGNYRCGYRQFLRDVAALPAVTATGITHGVKAALKSGLYVNATVGSARLDRVLFDHTEADIRLRRMFRREPELFRPWLTVLVDAATRMILSVIVTEGDGTRGDPTTESLTAMLAGAIRGRTAADGTFVGGTPRLVQFDNAKAHLANAMIHGYVEFGIATHAIEPGSPWQNGIVERLMRTITAEFLATLPGYTAALPDRYEHDPWQPADCMTPIEFVTRLAEWVDHYNYDRHHETLHTTPFEAWRDDPTPIERIDDAMLRHGFVAVAGNRIVSRQGIRFDNVDYIAVELGTLVGRKVSVRHLPNDRSFIDVYHADRFVCTARATARLGPEQRLEIIRDRRRAVRAVDSIIKRSRRRVIERAYEQHPALAPERDPTLPERHLTGDDDDFLTFLDTLERHDP